MATGEMHRTPIREDVTDAEARAWGWIRRSGTWLTARQKVAVAAEVRQAQACALCAERKAALSPYTVAGAHGAASDLPAVMVEVAHRIATDSGRVTRAWYESVLEQGMLEGEYVEILGLVATTIALDTFSRGYGRPLAALPEAQPGQPSRYRPAGAKHQLAWVPTLEPGDLTPDDPDIYAGYHPPYNIQKALSLVPEAMQAFFDLDETFYLQEQEILDFAHEYRALTHDQMELIAARLSALNRCYY